MFACLYSLSVPLAALVKTAEDFTPRFEVVGPLVMLDVDGLSRLFGTPREIGLHLRQAVGGPAHIAIAPTQSAAALLALGRAGLTVLGPGESPAALAPLAVTVLGEFDRLRVASDASPTSRDSRLRTTAGRVADAFASRSTAPPAVGSMHDVLPYFQTALDRTSDAAAAPHRALAATPAPASGGWMHPRDSHAAAQTRPRRRAVTPDRGLEHAPVPSASAAAGAASPVRAAAGQVRAAVKTELAALDHLLLTLRRWGIKTLGQLAALPPGDVYERLGARGVVWQRLARGEDSSPLVPWVPEEPFTDSLDLEWPIEGLEPLSFVLGRLFEPLSERLERADRGAAIVHTHLRLVDKSVHARTLQLPAPMRDPKTLRTLVLLDLETNPPAAAIDRVSVLAEPTPGRVTQWTLFERAQPSPEQVATLLARLSALMGDSHVGSPRPADSWKPGAFEMAPFQVSPAQTPADVAAASSARPASASSSPGQPSAASDTPHSALRRFRLPVPARVQMHDGRPARLLTDRRGITGGVVLQAAGPWRTSGEWWNDHRPGHAWDRDEWDVAMADGTVYRLYVERDIGQWFLEGVVD